MAVAGARERHVGCARERRLKGRRRPGAVPCVERLGAHDDRVAPLPHALCDDRAMANTSLLRDEVEPYIRAQLETEFGKVFTSQRLPLPGGATREFDAVSDDGSIVVSIKTSSGLTSGGNLPGGKIKAAIADLYYLSLISAPTKWLVLTNPKFHEIFSRVMDGAVSPEIEVRLMPLSAELQSRVDGVIAAAVDEMDRGKAVQAVATAIEEEAESAT